MKTIFILLFTITVLGSQAQTWTTKILSEKIPGLRVYNGTNWMKYSETTD